ncbi:MAG: SDR family oxidoreductase [Clostridiales Family XIII bacterium]|jgi:3-oxoacyl-[acyl-carrier protein] reductase|nr:SDR family oxidoreductase [Clostridiales Family XIII bacterium]
MGRLLEGKVAVVTGSGQGVGREIAFELARHGAKVVTNNRKPVGKNESSGNVTKDMEKAMSADRRAWFEKELADCSGDAETTARAIRDGGGEATAFFGNISDFETAGELIGTAVKAYGSADILFNVAGAFGFSPIETMTPELWDRVNRVKPLGYFNTIRHAVPHMIEKRWGRIINCTSRAWLGDVIKHAEYCAANGGVVSLTRAVAIELRDRGITANAFSPFARTRAAVDLEMYDKIVPEGEKAWVDPKFTVAYDKTPAPDMVAPFLVYLATDAAAHVSGTVFSVAGNRVGRYSDPEVASAVYKEGGKWTVEEFIATGNRTIFSDYKSLADR